MNTPSDDLQMEDMPHPDGYRGRHTVSGFDGCSGAPMCVFENGNLDSPKMIGICKFSDSRMKCITILSLALQSEENFENFAISSFDSLKSDFSGFSRLSKQPKAVE